MSTRVISITDGPSKMDLSFSLFISMPKKPTVNFTNELGNTFATKILGCVMEDGSGESFDLTGYAEIPYVGDSKHPGAVVMKSRRFKAHYRTDHREGWLEFETG